MIFRLKIGFLESARGITATIVMAGSYHMRGFYNSVFPNE